MRLSHPFRIAAAGVLFALALPASSASAHDGPPYDVPQPAWKQDRQQAPGMDPQARDAWLAECRDRLSIRDRRRDRDDGARGMDQCEAYLDNYYAQYGRGYQGYGYPAYGYGSPCCQPMMMAPVMRMPRGEPECTETVEYEYVDVPARPKPRPIPDKRVKIVPDKRIPIK